MNLDTAPTADREEDDADCGLCDGVYVLFEGDQVCRKCGHISGTGGDTEMTYRQRQQPDPWREFHRARRSDNYSGFRGPDRIKMVGGFAAAYDFDADF